MALPKVYSTGTASVSNNSTALTGSGTSWTDALVDGVFRKNGYSVRVASVEGYGAATLAEPWPGTALSDAAYEIAITYDGPETQQRVRELLERLQNTFGLTPSAIVAELTDRDAFDDEDEGFVILVADYDGNGAAGFYKMGSGGSADWGPVVRLSGADGTDGVTAGLRYVFDDSTADADPGAGKLRLNHASPASATAAYIDNVDNDGAAVTAYLDTWDDAVATVKGQLLIRSAATPATFALYTVTGSVVDGSGYRKLTLAYLAGNGSLAAADDLAVQFYRNGDAGYSPGYRLAMDAASTADGDPGAGKVRFNHATFGSITEIYIDDADASGADITAWLDGLDDVANANARAYLRLQKATDPDVYAEFAVTGTVIDGTGYRRIPVSPVAGAVPADATELVALATRSGADAQSGIVLAVSDETNAISGGAGKMTFRAPAAWTLTGVRASLKTASSSGDVVVDVNVNGVSILSTRITIEQGEKTSLSAPSQPVLSSTAIADDDEITIDIDGAGSGAVGLKVTLLANAA